jgi:adenylate kinase family enzyme
MKVINLFGAPGAGKSTTAAGLFFKMKICESIGSVELVTEFAKDLVYAGRLKELSNNQVYVTAKQYSRMERLREQVDYLITDSPLILGEIYKPENYFKSYGLLLKELYDSFDNINIIINRVKEYKDYGRMQTEKESDDIALRIRRLLKYNKINYHIVDGDEGAPDTILNVLLKR